MEPTEGGIFGVRPERWQKRRPGIVDDRRYSLDPQSFLWSDFKSSTSRKAYDSGLFRLRRLEVTQPAQSANFRNHCAKALAFDKDTSRLDSCFEVSGFLAGQWCLTPEPENLLARRRSNRS
jgi:hypothetical protein